MKPKLKCNARFISILVGPKKLLRWHDSPSYFLRLETENSRFRCFYGTHKTSDGFLPIQERLENILKDAECSTVKICKVTKVKHSD